MKFAVAMAGFAVVVGLAILTMFLIQDALIERRRRRSKR